HCPLAVAVGLQVNVNSGRSLSGQVEVAFEGELGPVAAGDLGDGEHGTPIVGHTIVSPRRHGRVAGLEGGEIVVSPTGQLAAEDGLNFRVAAVETGPELLLLFLCGFEEDDANRAATEGLVQGANARNHHGGESVE